MKKTEKIESKNRKFDYTWSYPDEFQKQFYKYLHCRYII